MIHFSIIILKILLIPVSLLYGLVIEIRNLLYNWGILKTFKFPGIVVSIGNLTLGGTGKTPFTIHLGRHLLRRYKIAVVSRGYGRASNGVQIVSDGEKIIKGADVAGDEPWLIARSLKKAIVLVSEKRKDAFEVLLTKYKPDLVILDDAFQHRSVHRDLDIVLINQKEKHFLALPLPSGRYREFPFNRKRADMVVCTNADQNTLTDKNNEFVCQTSASEYVDQHFNTAGEIRELRQKKALAFCGIANPDNFYGLLAENDIQLCKTISFRDHHNFTKSDWRKILNQSRINQCDIILCTEKDLVKVQPLINNEKPITELYAIRLELKLSDEKKFMNHLDELLDN